MENITKNTIILSLLTIGFIFLTSQYSNLMAQPAGYEFDRSGPLLKQSKTTEAPNGKSLSYFEYSYKVGETVAIFDYKNVEWVATKIIERTRNGIYNSYKTDPAFTQMMSETYRTNGVCEWISENCIQKIRRVN